MPLQDAASLDPGFGPHSNLPRRLVANQVCPGYERVPPGLEQAGREICRHKHSRGPPAAEHRGAQRNAGSARSLRSDARPPYHKKPEDG